MKALIIEDDLELAELIRACLRQRWPEMAVEHRDHGQMGWRRLQELSPDLLILDLKLPGVYGTEICAKARKAPGGEKLKIAILTSYLTPNVRKAIEDAGADLALEKPFDPDHFGEALRRLLEGKKSGAAPSRPE